ncbi:hypothetical protein DCS_02067 [Drechmeria coniospora]|uniref:Uncharacterized protein n=1 Tax=Drechmeria coniospora TaxID=98403 RepID=A0A151GUZ9_DRECN|nr:hypothetical protein DCS_02067 [Drechmeria coniospora]KYK60927.1 hypothetical protein DCS_02067 [Drechmeria coniospora]
MPVRDVMTLAIAPSSPPADVTDGRKRERVGDGRARGSADDRRQIGGGSAASSVTYDATFVGPHSSPTAPPPEAEEVGLAQVPPPTEGGLGASALVGATRRGAWWHVGT